MSNISRRQLLVGLGLGTGLVASGFSLKKQTAFFGIRPSFAQNGNDDLQTIINLAATAELFAATHYLEASINADALNLDDFERSYMDAGVATEYAHYELLVSLGAEPVVTEFYFPEGLFENRSLFSAVTEIAETVFVGAYLAATRIFSEMGATDLAVTAAQIVGVESEHRALARRMGLRLATNIHYAGYVFDNVSDAVPILQPFLDGQAEGFTGPVPALSANEASAVATDIAERGLDNQVTLGGEAPIDALPYALLASDAQNEDSEAEE
ncbi:MAG: hypothetical protein CUN55_02545 [Phototrophicales bacterium]|nr:MAG: hypothetical protein CUN55_02545 [Phototrophicales bacterium]